MTTKNIHAYSCYSPAAGSTRVRLYDWFRHLDLTPTRHQYLQTPNLAFTTILQRPIDSLNEERQLRKPTQRDAISIVSREASPLSTGLLESRILERSSHGVFDIDDALHEDSRLRRRAFGGARKFERAARAADVVIVGNDNLAEWATQFAADVRVIPSCVEPSDYELATQDGRPTMIWLGSPSTEKHLMPLLPLLSDIHRRTGTTLTLVSGPDPTALDQYSFIERTEWSMEGFAQALARSSVGLAPLVDDPFARGKCAYKILQYGASGLPIVGSPIGANARALELLGGVAATTEHDWHDALLSILTQPAQTRRKMGLAARQGVTKNYSFERWETAWMSAVLP